jgi:rubrerythrin
MTGVKEHRIVNGLVRAATMERVVEQAASHVSSLSLISEEKKRELYRVMVESGDHYAMLVNEFEGLEQAVEKVEERVARGIPVPWPAKEEMEALITQLKLERSMKIAYGELLEDVKRLGVQVASIDGIKIKTESAERVLQFLANAEERHAAIVKGIIDKFRQSE